MCRQSTGHPPPTTSRRNHRTPEKSQPNSLSVASVRTDSFHEVPPRRAYVPAPDGADDARTMHIPNVHLRLDVSELVTSGLEEALDIGIETAHRLALREKAQGMTAQVAADRSNLQQAVGDRARSHDLAVAESTAKLK